MAGRTSINVVPIASLHAVQGDALTIRYQGEGVTLHSRMPWEEFQENQRRIIQMLGDVASAKVRHEAALHRNINADAIDDASEVYGETDFDYPDDICDKASSGHHEYDALREPERCIHCGETT